MNETLKLAMLGMVDGNGHPYSWSAIFNRYDPIEMLKCPYAGIPAYLDSFCCGKVLREKIDRKSRSLYHRVKTNTMRKEPVYAIQDCLCKIL